jgi:threonine/homoserine/homoserine lactone efflux protein
MPGLDTLTLFSLAALALFVVPGPAVLFIVAQSMRGGRRAGLMSVVGIHIGSLVHVAAAALGLSSLLASSARAFEVVKYAGAAYLVYLGLRRMRERSPGVACPAASEPETRGRALRQGMVVQVLNPKTALFFLAFLPQFVDVSSGPVALQILVLGVAFVLLGLLSDGAWAVAAGSATGFLGRRATFARGERYVSGGVLMGLGVATALSRPGRG